MITRCLDDGGHKYRKAYDGRKGFKFMKIKKLVAMLATAAMAVGLVVAAPSQAKAADELYLHGYWGGSDVAGTTHKFENGSIEMAFSGDAYVYVNDGSKDYKTSGWQGDVAENTEVELSATATSPDKLKIPAGTWVIKAVKTSSGYKISYSKKTVADPSEVIAKINAIGTVAYTGDCLAKIEAAEAAYESYTGEKSGVTNYATLTAARAKFDELKAAAMGKVTVYVKNSDWNAVYAYTFGPETLGTWPGTALEKDAKNSDWYVFTATITDMTSIIFNNNDGKQTPNLKLMEKGTYWMSLTNDTLADAAFSATAPTGWVGSGNGGSGSTPTPTPTPTPEAPDTADVAPVVAMVAVAALAAVVVLKKRTVNE